MRGVRLLKRSAWLAALGMLSCAPAADLDAFRGEAEPGALEEAHGYSGIIDVARSAPVSLSLGGGLGPIVEGQTVNRAIVSLETIELVGADGTIVPLLDQPITVDLLAVQNDLEQLVAGIPLPPGQFTHFRVQMGGALIEVTDDQGALQYFATPGFDIDQFGLEGVSGPIELVGIEPGGYFEVPVPQDGIAIDREAALALQLDPALSLSYQDGIWAFEPRAWVVDQAMLSSLEVAFQAEAAGFSEFATQGGFQVTLFDAGMYPVATAPLGLLPSGLPGANFQYLAPFQGPFVAVLVPPPGVQLTSVVSVSVDVRASAHVFTSISINSFHEVHRVGGVPVFDIGFAPYASVIQRAPTGGVLLETTMPVGPIDAVMPRVAPRLPLLPGQRPPRIFRQAPYLPGLPRPIHVGPGRRPWLLPDVHHGRPRRWRPGERHRFPGERPGVIRPGERPRFPGQRPGVTRPGERPGFPGQRPGVTRPGERPGFPGQRPGVTRPGERPGFPGQRPGVTRPGERPPGQRPGVTRPGERPGFPGQRPGVTRPGDRRPGERPGVTRPGERRGVPGERPGVSRPGERRGVPGERPGASGSGERRGPGEPPGVTRPGRGTPGARPGVIRPGERGPSERRSTTIPGRSRPMPSEQGPRVAPRRGRGESGIRPPVSRPESRRGGQIGEPDRGRRPEARRPGDHLGAPKAPPAMRRLEAPVPTPEARPRIDPRRPSSARPPARTPSSGRDQGRQRLERLTTDGTQQAPDDESPNQEE